MTVDQSHTVSSTLLENFVHKLVYRQTNKRMDRSAVQYNACKANFALCCNKH